MRTVEEAVRFAQIAHAGQADRSGAPYLDHLLRVAGAVRASLAERGITGDEALAAEQAAVLHDVIEDTGVTADALRAEGLGERAIGLISALSRPDGPGRPTYAEWISAIAASGDEALILIKMADNRDNASPARIAALPPGERGIARRYERAWLTLSAGLAELRGGPCAPG